MTKKEEYERLIDSSQLFMLDKEKEYSAFCREESNLIKNLYMYLMEANRNKYEPYGLEIVETAKRCIKNYDPDSGRFLNYFSSAWKKNYDHTVGKEIIKDDYCGIHFSEGEIRNYQRIVKMLNDMGNDTKSPDFSQKAADIMGISVVEVENLKKMIESKPSSGTYVNEEGEEYSLLDQIDSGNYTDEGILQFEAAREFLDILELTYDQLQERQKPMLAMLITSKIALLVNEDERLLEMVKNKSYYDENAFCESLQRGEQIQAKEIAEKFGVVEASASRTWKSFREKVKSEKGGKKDGVR